MHLEASEAKYQALFEGASDAVFIMRDWRFIEWNPVALEMFGCAEEDIPGTHPADFSPELQPNGASSRERVEGFMREAWEGTPQRFEWMHQRLDGTPFPADVSLTRVETTEGPFMLAVVRDITEQKEVEAALRTSEAKYRTFFENSCDPMIMMKGDIFVDCNAAAVEAFGFESKVQILDTHPAELSPELQADGTSSYDKAAEMIEATHAHGTHRFEWLHVRTDGEVFPVEVSMTVVPSEDGTTLLCVLRDISYRDQAMKARETLEAQLRQSQKMQAVGQLAGGVAHDFNNLLQAILGYGEMVLWDLEPGSSIQDDLDEVIKAANRASDLVRHLLAFSRRQTLKLEVIDLDVVVEELSKMIRRVIGENIAYSTTSLPGASTVLADQGQIEQILMNLCLNSRDAMPGGGELTIQTGTAELTKAFCRDNPGSRPGRHARIMVKDTGHGMDEATRARAFEPFFTTKEETHGTGLGLSTVYGIVKQHEGYIKLSSEPCVGTTVDIYLPEAEGTAKARDEPEALPAPAGSEVILLAEDDNAVRRLAEKHLQDAGYTVWSARDGAEAIRMFDEDPGSVDLALLDVVMPAQGGRAVLDHIRDSGHDTPVLFASGYSAGAVHADFILERGLHLLRKPYRREELLTIVRELLDA